MTQIATVNRLFGADKAEVQVRRPSACGHDCKSCGGCGPDTMTQVTAVAENEVGARPGDTVRVESESRTVLGLAAVLYLMPIVLLFVGYFIASGLLEFSEGGSLLIGLGFMAAGFAGNRLVDRRLRSNRAVRFRIVEVLKPCSDM